VCLKIVAQLPGRNKYIIKKLVCLKIPGLCLMEDLADVVDRLLDGFGPLWLVPAPQTPRLPSTSWWSDHHLLLGELVDCRGEVVLLSTTSTMLTASKAAAMYKYNGSPELPVLAGTQVAVSTLERLVLPLRSKKMDLISAIAGRKGSALSASLEMKRLRAASDPASF
jgi:hypothetical protein